MLGIHLGSSHLVMNAVCIWLCKANVYASHAHYRALGSQLIPVYRQSARRWLEVIHPAVGCHYFPLGLRLPSQTQSITVPWPIPSYTAWWQKQIGVKNLPKVVTQLLPRVGFEPTTCWSQVQCPTHCATAPSTSLLNYFVKYKPIPFPGLTS